MNIRIRTYARFAEMLGREQDLELPEGTGIPQTLECLVKAFPTARQALFGDSGELRGYVILVLNGRRLSRSEIPSIVLRDGDELTLLPPVAGG